MFIDESAEKNKAVKGKLKIFFGYAAGVGKSYAMLLEAYDMKMAGMDIVIGYVEPHNRPDTMALTEGIESIGTKQINYKGMNIKEFDLERALARKPDIIIVDELAHTNIDGLRHKKRWQDVEELLNRGINVYTTLNVQHIEGLNDIVESITNISVKETIPDKIFDKADKVELIDIEPDELLRRFSDGKIYSEEQTKKAFSNFFTKSNLFALREIALRRTADRINYEVESVRLSKGQITVMPTSDPILACIGSSPSSSKVIRTAARMAEAYHSKFIAVYVETSKLKNISDEEKKTLTNNFNLAEQLGGEVAVLNGDDIVEQIIGFARFRNVTKIIIGKNHRNVHAKDIVDELMRSNLYIDVYVIPNLLKKKRKKFLFNKNIDIKVSLKEILMLVTIMAAATMISLLFDFFGFKEANIIMIYILGVIIISINTHGYFLGFISSIISVMLFNFFFTAPRLSLQIYDKSYLATFPMMIIVTFIIGTLTNKIQKEAYNSIAREKMTQVFYRVIKKLLSATGTTDVVAIGIKYISRLLDMDVVCYLADNDKLSTPFIYKAGNKKSSDDKSKNNILNKAEEAALYWTFLNGKESGRGTSTFYGARGYYIPLKRSDKVLGVIGVACGDTALKAEQKSIFETIASQISIALDREILAEVQKKSNMEIESERLRSNLLRSISHDLRSPLAGIKGSVSTIIENKERINEETEEELLKGIYDDTEWLIRLVENLLSMTKFDEGRMEVKKNMEIVEEVVYEAVQRTSKSFIDHEIKVNVPDKVIVAPMDGGLIEQVLINLIDNAIKYTSKGSLIKINVLEEANKILFQVSDNGGGIPSDILPFIFDRFFTNGSKISDSRRGVGLGLAICKSIVEAHGGTIEASNNKEGGAVFKFYIPKEESVDGK